MNGILADELAREEGAGSELQGLVGCGVHRLKWTTSCYNCTVICFVHKETHNYFKNVLFQVIFQFHPKAEIYSKNYSQYTGSCLDQEIPWVYFFNMLILRSIDPYYLEGNKFTKTARLLGEYS